MGQSGAQGVDCANNIDVNQAVQVLVGHGQDRVRMMHSGPGEHGAESTEALFRYRGRLFKRPAVAGVAAEKCQTLLPEALPEFLKSF